MTEPTLEPGTKAWLDALITTAFGEWPSQLGPLSTEAIAQADGANRVALSVRSGIRNATALHLPASLPSATALFESLAGGSFAELSQGLEGDLSVEVGPDRSRIIATHALSAGTQSAGTVRTIGGTDFTMWPATSPLDTLIPAGPLRTAVLALAKALPHTPWLIFRDADQNVQGALTVADALAHDLIEAEALRLASGSALERLLAFHRDAYTHPVSWWFEFDAQGQAILTLSGARAFALSEEDLQSRELDLDTMREQAIRTILSSLPPADAPQAETILRKELFPAALELEEDGLDTKGLLGRRTSWITGQLGNTRASERLALLQALAVSARLTVIYEQAYAIAVAVYLKTHTVPADRQPALPVSITELSLDELQKRAAELAKVATPLCQAASEDTALTDHYVPGRDFILSAILPTLEPAIHALFVEGHGPLFDFIDSLGSKAFDDDPALISLDHANLESSAREAAMKAWNDQLAEGSDTEGG